MDMHQILAVFNSLQNNNLSATPPTSIIEEIGEVKVSIMDRVEYAYNALLEDSDPANTIKTATQVLRDALTDCRRTHGGESCSTCEDISRVLGILRHHDIEGAKDALSDLMSDLQRDSSGSICESAPSDQEAWVKKHKKAFIDQYGKDRGLEVLYATAWTRHNKKKGLKESICRNCTADGVVPCQACRGQEGNSKCPECKGSGEITCPECSGKGHVEEKSVKKMHEAYHVNDTHQEGADDYCEACFRRVATHEENEGLLCDHCYHDIYGGEASEDDEPFEDEESEMIDPSIMWRVKESKEYDGPIEAYGVRGMNSKQWRKTFKNQAAFEKWMEKNEGDVDVQGTRNLNECDQQALAPMTPPSTLNVSTSYDSATNRKSISVTADNDKAEELARILQLSGLIDGGPVENEPEPKEILMEPTEEECMENEDPWGLDESKVTESYRVEFDSPKGHQFLKMGGSGKMKTFVSSEKDATVFDDQKEAKSKAGELKMTGKYTSVKVVPVMNESLLNELRVRGHECDFCGNSLEQDDYSAPGSWNYTCGSCGFRYSHGGDTPEAQIRKQIAKGKIDPADSQEPMYESLSPSRKSEGHSWANEPNEQMAHWQAVCDDTQGLSKPHDMFPNRLGDNPLKVAKNKKDEPLHEDSRVNALAQKLSDRFKTQITESTKPITKKGKKVGDLTQSEDGSITGTLYEKTLPDISTYPGDKPTQKLRAFLHSREGLKWASPNPEGTETSGKRFGACPECQGTGKDGEQDCPACGGSGDAPVGDPYYE
jgi:hypothetical protein